MRSESATAYVTPLTQAFANFLNIQSAIKCIEGLKYHKDYQSMKISFGKDRCGNPPRFLGKLPIPWPGALPRPESSAGDTSRTEQSADAEGEPASPIA